jgi:archaeosine synthase beta-subunit
MKVGVPSIYPASAGERDKWILDRRGPRATLDPWRPHAFFVENECSATGEAVSVACVFLTNRECPWRCLMCDLWHHTLTETVPLGAIPAQVQYALERLPPAREIKLYNSGSFFDRHAIPPDDYPAIAGRVNSFERVIVESHPALIGKTCLRFRDLTKGRLEVAMGLETAHPEILSRLNKRMTLDEFSRAAEWLRGSDIDLRAFILVKPPFIVDDEEALYWAKQSLDFAFDAGARAVSLIPTRAGNGAMDELEARGEFAMPRLETLEAAADYGLKSARGRVFVDLWDVQRLSACRACFNQRVSRLNEMNLRQSISPHVACERCGGV